MKFVDLLATALVTLVSWFFLNLILSAGVSIASLAFGPEDWLGSQLGSYYWVIAAVGFVLASFVGRVCWKVLRWNREGAYWWAVRGALVLGGLGLVGGVFGPILLAPEANQGPFIGIFFSGPIGFLLGGMIGCFLGRPRTARKAPEDSPEHPELWKVPG